MGGFMGNRIKAIRYALKGMLWLFKNETNFQVQFVIAVLVTLAGFYFEITATEWILQTLTIGLIMSLEGINTAVEKLADFVHPNPHPKIGLIKDISAAGVLFAAIIAVVIGIIIYFPYLIHF